MGKGVPAVALGRDATAIRRATAMETVAGTGGRRQPRTGPGGAGHWATPMTEVAGAVRNWSLDTRATANRKECLCKKHALGCRGSHL
jgi:hypothetical protein